MSQCIEHVQGSEKVCTEGPDSLCLSSLFFFFFFLNHRATYSLMGSLTPLWDHWYSPETTQGLAASHSLWSSPCLCEVREAGVMGILLAQTVPLLVWFPTSSWGQSWARATPPDSRSEGEPSAVPWAPEGPLPRRVEATPPPWAIFRDSGRVLSVPGVQSSAWTTFSFSTSLESKKGQSLVLPSSPLLNRH